MSTIHDLVEEHVSTRAPGWLVLDLQESMQCALRAARFYAAYGPIKSIQPDGNEPIKTILAIAPSTCLTVGEWGLIMPLFVLYLELENALRLEASRANGLEPYGRDSTTIAGDITIAESDMPTRAFRKALRILGYNGGDELPPPRYFSSLGGYIYPLLPADGA